ncbi:MAG: radical SAM protein [Deltaproteobacteria bacterium]|nr:radical SAM protein [Deltaproteobacteria bacterium]
MGEKYAPQKALLKVGYKCNNNCVFCHSAPHRGSDSSFATLEKKIITAASLGAQTLVLSGGEPTIRPDLLDLADCINSADMSLGLVTNGRMLAYPKLVEQLARRKLDYVYLSLSGANQELHNRHVRTKAFKQALRGLEQLSGIIRELTINVVVTRWNFEHLIDFVPLAQSLEPIRLKFSMLEPEGNALEDLQGLVPDLSDAVIAVTKVFENVSADSGVSFAIDGFPACLIPDELEEFDSGLRDDGFFVMSEAFEDDWHPVDDRNRSFTASCLQCSLKRRCRGVFEQYIRLCRGSELKPVSRMVSNSFNFEPQGQAEKMELSQCPIRSGLRPPPDPVRGIAVVCKGNEVQHYIADTRDFSDAAISEAVGVLGQVYKDQGNKVLLDDFSKDLVPLSLASECNDCSMKPLCGGVWQATKDNSFEHARAIVVQLLTSLNGSVLDIGCGQMPYRSDLEPLIANGRLTYLGIDPGADPADNQVSLQFMRTSLEDFKWAGPLFDTILALRSLNHLDSIQAALLKMTSLVRLGGRIVLAEDEVFGVVRTKQTLQAERKQSDLPYDHRVNLGLSEAVELAKECQLTIEEKLSPIETKSTLWLLVCRKSKN